MKTYEVKKIVFANNIQELTSLERGGEIIEIKEIDEVRNYEDIGFVKTYGKKRNNRKGHTVV